MDNLIQSSIKEAIEYNENTCQNCRRSTEESGLTYCTVSSVTLLVSPNGSCIKFRKKPND